MDQGRLEELKRLLDERRSNTKQNLDRELDAENSDAQNSDNSNSNASNFDASDLNNTNSKALNSNDKNSDGLNLNMERDRKFQNLDPDNTTLFKNSNARNYDKDPIIIKNYEKFFVYCPSSCISSGIRSSNIFYLGYCRFWAYICRRLFRSLYNDITNRRYYIYLYRDTQ